MRSTDKCLHGLFIISGHSTCSICKGWPSIERMRNAFPGLSETTFLIMTPAERLEAMRTGEIKGLKLC